jgi:hypothetical protein
MFVERNIVGPRIRLSFILTVAFGATKSLVLSEVIAHELEPKPKQSGAKAAFFKKLRRFLIPIIKLLLN